MCQSRLKESPARSGDDMILLKQTWKTTIINIRRIISLTGRDRYKASYECLRSVVYSIPTAQDLEAAMHMILFIESIAGIALFTFIIVPIDLKDLLAVICI